MNDELYNLKSVLPATQQSGRGAASDPFLAGMAELRANLEQGFHVTFRHLKNHAFVESARVNRHSSVPKVAKAANDALMNLVAVAAREGVRKENIKIVLRDLEQVAEDDPDTWTANRPLRRNGDAAHIASNGERIAVGFGRPEGRVRSQPKDQLITVQASQIAPKRIEWLWPERFALGKLGLIGGFPDVGKSQLVAYFASAISNGGDWPCHEGQAPRGDVLLFCTEDDAADTVIPRLIAAGANRDRVHLVPMVRTKSGSELVFSIVHHLPILRQKLEELPDVKLIVIDPLAAHLGIGQVNTSRGADIRATLTPLVQIAQEKRISTVGIMHFNKSQNVTNAMLRISDSLAFVAQARHCYVAVEDDETEGRFYFVRAKNNLGPRARQALAYTISTNPIATDELGEIRAPYVVWDIKYVEGKAADMIDQALGARNGRPVKTEDAVEFIRSELTAGSLPSERLFELGRKEGFSERTLNRAKREAGAISRKTGLDGGWIWELSPDAR
jgi:putative DNA primase/helicase